MGERWDRDRFEYERADRRHDDDRYYMRGGRGGRDHSEERFDRGYRRAYEDDMVRDRRYHDDDLRYAPRREPPPAPEYDRRRVMEQERERDYHRDDYSPRRPAFLRRQSSLDTFDRRLGPRFSDREEYPPPARREDIYRGEHRAPPYTDIPLPKTKALPPPRRPGERYYEDIRVAEPDYYGDDDFRPPPERVTEREVVRTRRRDQSRDHSRDTASTKTRTRRGSSPSSTTTSRSSSSSGGTTVRSEYPKKGKTRIPARLVSKRAIIDLRYPFVEEGTTIIIQRALGQDNIDELLKLSDEYKKSEQEVAAARSSAGNLAEERREEAATMGPPPPLVTPGPPPPPAVAPITPGPPPVMTGPPPPPPAPMTAPAPAPAPVVLPTPGPPPMVTPGPPPPPGPVVVDARPVRDHSPSATTSTSSSSWDSHYAHHHHYDAGPVALAHRSRSRSKSRHEIRAEIKALERELVHRPKHELGLEGRELVRAERLPDGQLVLYEEEVEKVVHHSKPPRIEKDKKGPPPKLVRAMLSTLT